MMRRFQGRLCYVFLWALAEGYKFLFRPSITFPPSYTIFHKTSPIFFTMPGPPKGSKNKKTKEQEEAEKQAEARKAAEKQKKAEAQREAGSDAKESAARQRETCTTYGPRELSPHERRVLLQAPATKNIEPLSQWTHPITASLSATGFTLWKVYFNRRIEYMKKEGRKRNDNEINPFTAEERFYDIVKKERTTREWWTMILTNDIKWERVVYSTVQRYGIAFAKHQRHILAEFQRNSIPKERVPGWITVNPFDQKALQKLSYAKKNPKHALPKPLYDLQIYVWMQLVEWGGFLIADWVTAMVDPLLQVDNRSSKSQQLFEPRSATQGSSRAQDPYQGSPWTDIQEILRKLPGLLKLEPDLTADQFIQAFPANMRQSKAAWRHQDDPPEPPCLTSPEFEKLDLEAPPRTHISWTKRMEEGNRVYLHYCVTLETATKINMWMPAPPTYQDILRFSRNQFDEYQRRSLMHDWRSRRDLLVNRARDKLHLPRDTTTNPWARASLEEVLQKDGITDIYSSYWQDPQSPVHETPLKADPANIQELLDAKIPDEWRYPVVGLPERRPERTPERRSERRTEHRPFHSLKSLGNRSSEATGVQGAPQAPLPAIDEDDTNLASRASRRHESPIPTIERSSRGSSQVGATGSLHSTDRQRHEEQGGSHRFDDLYDVSDDEAGSDQQSSTSRVAQIEARARRSSSERREFHEFFIQGYQDSGEPGFSYSDPPELTAEELRQMDEAVERSERLRQEERQAEWDAIRNSHLSRDPFASPHPRDSSPQSRSERSTNPEAGKRRHEASSSSTSSKSHRSLTHRPGSSTSAPNRKKHRGGQEESKSPSSRHRSNLAHSQSSSSPADSARSHDRHSGTSSSERQSSNPPGEKEKKQPKKQ